VYHQRLMHFLLTCTWSVSSDCSKPSSYFHDDKCCTISVF